MAEIRKPHFTESIDLNKIREITCQLDKELFPLVRGALGPPRDRWAHTLACTIITTGGKKGDLFFRKEFVGFSIKNNKLLLSGNLSGDTLEICE